MDHPIAARAVAGRCAANAKRSEDCAPEEPVEALLWVVCLKMYNVTWSEIFAHRATYVSLQVVHPANETLVERFDVEPFSDFSAK